MKSLMVLALVTLSTISFAQTKAVKEVVPGHAIKTTKTAKAAEVPCDTKEDILKKLEEKKKEQESQGKGFALQGAKDTGCSIK